MSPKKGKRIRQELDGEITITKKKKTENKAQQLYFSTTSFQALLKNGITETNLVRQLDWFSFNFLRNSTCILNKEFYTPWTVVHRLSFACFRPSPFDHNSFLMVFLLLLLSCLPFLSLSLTSLSSLPVPLFIVLTIRVWCSAYSVIQKAVVGRQEHFLPFAFV